MLREEARIQHEVERRLKELQESSKTGINKICSQRGGGGDLLMYLFQTGSNCHMNRYLLSRIKTGFSPIM